MTISHYLKAIGRGERGARNLPREQAADLFDQVINGRATDLEVGAFCLAMRVKGETPGELAGFVDATNASMSTLPPSNAGLPTVIIPSYNGARKLPVLTPLLAILLSRGGMRVVIHGVPSEPGRTTTAQVLTELGCAIKANIEEVDDREVNYFPIEAISQQLHRLIEIRRVIGLRNSAHSVVKLINPNRERALILASYTHAAYAKSMAETFQILRADALLIRGIEGEPVADARKIQQIETFSAGERMLVQEAGSGGFLPALDWPSDVSPGATAQYIVDVLENRRALPETIVLQIAQIKRAVASSGWSHGTARRLIPSSTFPGQ